MIRTKEDFKGKYIKLPKNLSEKKFNRINDKLERLGLNTFMFYYSSIEKYPYIAIEYNNFDIIMWNKKSNEDKSRKQKKEDKYLLSLQQISIKDFLEEEKKDENYTINIKSDLNIHLLLSHISTNIKDFGSKVEIEEYEFKEDGLYVKGKIKDYNPHLTIAGVEIAYCPQCINKARKFKTEEEAIKWCYNNPMKEVSYNIPYSPYIYKERYNPNAGTLGLERYFEFKNEEGDWKFDENCLLESEKTIKWINIRECK